MQALDRWGRRIVPDPTAENFSRLWDALAAVDARPAEGGDFKPEEMPVPFVRAGLIEAAATGRSTRSLGESTGLEEE